jgi:hypothetical protein
MSQLIKFLIRILSHNDNHFIKVKCGVDEVRLCTRCTGMLLGLIVSLPVIIILGANRAPGGIVAGIAVSLFLPDFLYWALTRVRRLPDKNPIRVLNGFVLGVGITLFGQANLPWRVKAGIPVLLFLAVILGNPILGRRRPIKEA